jgi:hypothetical protein
MADAKIDFPSEAFIEDYVTAYIRENKECPISGDDVHRYYRQYEIKGYGITDLIKLSFDEDSCTVTILELKNETLKESHYSQLARYIAGANRIKDRLLIKYPHARIYVKGELAGPFDSSKNDLVYLNQLCDDINIYDLSLLMSSGFSVNHIANEGWRHISENPSRSDADVRAAMLHQKNVAAQYRESLKKVISISGADHASL